jgi:hypothetical protein
MTSARVRRSMRRARAFAGATALLASAGPAGAAAAEPTSPASVVTAPAAAADTPETYPLIFLFQGDAVVDSTPSGPGDAGGNDPTAGSHLQVRRLRVGEDVWSGAFRARVFLEASSPDVPFAPVEGQRLPHARYVRLPEAFVAWRPHRAVEFDAGGQRVPFSLSRQVDAFDLRLPERPQVVVALAPDYRTGLAFTSDLGALNLRLAGMSADRSLDAELFSSGFFGAARISADPIGPMGTTPWRRSPADPWYCWPRFSAGVSILYGTLLAPRTLAFGADGQLQARRVTITGEYLAQHVGGGAAALPAQGADLEPGVFIIKERLELVLRGAWYRQPAPASGSTDTLAAGGALTFFARQGHLRVQGGLELRHTLDDRLPSSGWGIVRLSLAL